MDLDITQIPPSGTVLSGGDNMVTITLTDKAGNFSEVSFPVNVIDNPDPVLSCIVNHTVDVGDSDYYPVKGTEFDPVQFSDNIVLLNFLRTI